MQFELNEANDGVDRQLSRQLPLAAAYDFFRSVVSSMSGGGSGCCSRRITHGRAGLAGHPCSSCHAFAEQADAYLRATPIGDVACGLYGDFFLTPCPNGGSLTSSPNPSRPLGRRPLRVRSSPNLAAGGDAPGAKLPDHSAGHPPRTEPSLGKWPRPAHASSSSAAASAEAEYASLLTQQTSSLTASPHCGLAQSIL